MLPQYAHEFVAFSFGDFSMATQKIEGNSSFCNEKMTKDYVTRVCRSNCIEILENCISPTHSIDFN